MDQREYPRQSSCASGFARRQSSVPRMLDWVAPLLLMVAIAAFAHAISLPGYIGFWRDDGMYVLYGKALATGQGYVDLALPGHPPADRYPIGFPALLALVLSGSSSIEMDLWRLQWVPPLALAAFVGTSYVWLRREAAWSRAVALGAVTIMACNPMSLHLATNVLSDLVYGVIAIGALLVLEKAWRSPAGHRLWWASGVVVGWACLTRYYAFVLVLAVVVALATRRRWQPLGFFGSGVGVLLAPWVVFRLIVGGETYVSALGGAFGATLSQGILPLAFGFQFGMGSGFPGLVLPFFNQVEHPAGLVVGALLSAVALLGTVNWLRQPVDGHSPIAPLFLGGSAVLALVMEVGYAGGYHGHMVSRFLVPTYPLVLLAIAKGGEMILEVFRVNATVIRKIAVAGLVLAVGSAGASLNSTWREFRAFDLFVGAADYPKIFAFIRTRTPTNAKLLCFFPHAFRFYTGRFSFYNPAVVFGSRWVAGVPDVLGALRSTQADYMVATPLEAGGAADPSTILLRALYQECPRLFVTIYASPSQDYVVLRVDRDELNAAIRRLTPR